MRVQDFRHFLPAICGLRPQTTFRRPRVRVFTPAAVLAPVAIPSFFPPEVLDLTHLFLFRYDQPLAPEKRATPPISLIGTEIPLPSPNSSASPSCRQGRYRFLPGRSVPELTDPFADIAGARPIQQFPFFPIDVGICLFQRRRAIRDAAAPRGGERYDRFAVQIVTFDERIDDTRRKIPPNGITEKNHVVAVRVQLPRRRLPDATPDRSFLPNCATACRSNRGRALV